MLDATPLFRFYARTRGAALDREDAVAQQQRQLLRLVQAARATRFGRDHHFDAIHSVADFQDRVPLRRYEDMWSQYWQAAFPVLTDCTWPGTIPYFALSSGTSSGTTKYIPCSREMNRANDRAALTTLVHHVRARPHSRVLGGKTFMLGGSTDLAPLAPGILAGDLSGIASARVPFWAGARIFPPRGLALIPDWEKKTDVMVRAIPGQDIRAIGGTPSWLLIFFQTLFARHPHCAPTLSAFFPDLELLIHGGVNFAPYRARFDALLAGTHAETREVYAASEGFIAAADCGPGDGMRLMADNGLFFEFVPCSELNAPMPTRHWLATAETGVDYALALSSCAGLWSYLLGDIVRFVSRAPPRILVAGRLAYDLSAFGEHLRGEEIEDAVTQAAVFIGARLAEFSVGAIFPEAGQMRGGHLFIIEFDGDAPAPAQAASFLARIDQSLSRGNDDYRAHRADGFGLEPPRLIAVAPGTFQAWMKIRGKLGGQNKVPRLIADPPLFAQLHAFALRHLAKPG
jgi:hypothetical protein